MTTSVKLIEHSISENGVEIMSVECRYPRFIHSELMTHRVFSRNAASSRAIPIKKMLNDIKTDMVIPSYWGKNQSGMQAKEELTGTRLWMAKTIWILTGRMVCFFVWLLSKVGLHKQIANRMLEPWSHITVLITSTYWKNFYALRNHKDAQPEIRELAKLVFEAHQGSIPKLVKFGEWHLPYVTLIERLGLDLDKQKLISIARCASTSYKTVDGKEMTTDKAIELSNKLVGSYPLHASPIEHQATPDESISVKYNKLIWKNPDQHGNFYGWIQNRKTYDNEFVDDYSTTK